MNAIQNNLKDLTNSQKIQIIVLLKQSIKILISTTALNTQIKFTSEYKNTIKDLTNSAGNQTKIIDSKILKYFQYFIIKHTTRGYLFPSIYETLLLELIQILEYSCISFPTQTSV